MIKGLTMGGVLLFSFLSSADTLGFVEQKFGDLHFQRGKWSRTAQLPCYTYTAQEDGATVEVIRYGMSNLVSLKAVKGLRVTVCGDIAAFEEGFETPASATNLKTSSLDRGR
jgi:hypothetical protein